MASPHDYEDEFSSVVANIHPDEGYSDEYTDTAASIPPETNFAGDFIRGIGSDLGYAAGLGVPGVANVTAGTGRLIADEAVNLFAGKPNPPLLNQFGENLLRAQVDLLPVGKVIGAGIKGAGALARGAGRKIGEAAEFLAPEAAQAVRETGGKLFSEGKDFATGLARSAGNRLFKSSAIIPRALGVGISDVENAAGARNLEQSAARLAEKGFNAGTKYNPRTGTFDLLVGEGGEKIAPGLTEYTAKNAAKTIEESLPAVEQAQQATIQYLDNAITKSDIPGIKLTDLTDKGLFKTFDRVRDNVRTAFGSDADELLKPIRNVLSDFGKKEGTPLFPGSTIVNGASGPTGSLGFGDAANMLTKIQTARNSAISYGERFAGDEAKAGAVSQVVQQLDDITAALKGAIGSKEAEVVAKFGPTPTGRSLLDINQDYHDILTMAPLARRASGEAFVGAANSLKDLSGRGLQKLGNAMGAGGGLLGGAAGYGASTLLPGLAGPAGTVIGMGAGAVGTSTPGRLIRAAIGQRGVNEILPKTSALARGAVDLGQWAADTAAGAGINTAAQGDIVPSAQAEEPLAGPSKPLPVLFPTEVRADGAVPSVVDPFANGLPRQTDIFDSNALNRFVQATANRPTGVIAQGLAQKYEEAVRSQDKFKQQRIVADMAKLFPDVFEPGMGVDDRLFHPDDQAEYMDMLKGAHKSGKISSIFMGKQMQSFADKNDSRVLPIDEEIAKLAPQGTNIPPQNGEPRQYPY